MTNGDWLNKFCLHNINLLDFSWRFKSATLQPWAGHFTTVIPGCFYVRRPTSCLAVALAVFSVSFTSAQLFQ